MITTAVIFINYGPYHVARARALTERTEIAPFFVELASVQRKYTWSSDKRMLGDRLITLLERPYEECRNEELNHLLTDALDRIHPDIVAIAGYGDPPMRAAAHWARKRDVGVVMMSDSTEVDYRRRWWKERLKRHWVSRHVDSGLVAGRRARTYLEKLGVPHNRIWDRYDVVDNAYFARRSDLLRAEAGALRKRAGLPARYFLFVGRFAPEKNLLVLLEAYRRYHSEHPDGWSLVLVGDGPQRDYLRRAAEERHLHGLIWPGYKQFDELPSYYAFAGCFVLPSTLEPWGLVVNEAMASGLPILASCRCGSAADLIQAGRNGFTFDPADSAQLAYLMGRIAELPDDYRENMGLASREIISDWTPGVWAEQLVAAIRAAAR